MKLNSYLIPVVTYFSLFLLLLFYLLFLFELIQLDTFLPLLLGIGIPLLNFLTGIYSIRVSINKTHSIFLLIFLGGMIFRLFLMLIAVFLVLKFLENLADSFIFIIFIFYTFYLISEILYLNQLKSR